MKSVDIIVTGQVQGVFFRASTREKARALNLNGWCENKADGSVFIHTEGSEEKIQELVKWCYKGSENAVVTDVQVRDSAFTKASCFHIKRF